MQFGRRRGRSIGHGGSVSRQGQDFALLSGGSLVAVIGLPRAGGSFA
jgi:hypothetical protein